MRELSLRARLVVGVLALALVGLAAADVATYTSLRSFLVSASTRPSSVRFFTAGATEGGDRFRVRAAIEGGEPTDC